MPRSTESNACTPTTAPTTLACWRSTANLASFLASKSSFSRRHCDLKHERTRTPADNVSSMSIEIPAIETLDLAETGYAIVVEGLRKSYGSVVAVDDISFRVQEREIFGLLGPNGAGKTTTVEILEGLRQADAGRAVVAGIDVLKTPQKVKSRIGVQLQASAFFDYLTLAELIEMFAALYDRPIDAGDLLKRVGLEEKAGGRVKTLSGGRNGSREDHCHGRAADPGWQPPRQGIPPPPGRAGGEPGGCLPRPHRPRSARGITCEIPSRR